MPDLITSVGGHKNFPYISTLGCPGTPAQTGHGSNSSRPAGPQLVRKQQPPLKSTTVRISSGDRGIAETIRFMYGGVMGNEGVRNAEIIRTARQVVANVPSRDQAGEIAAVLQWVKSNIKFRGEYAETVQTPLVTLQLRAGDCDDQSALMAALLGSLGYKTRFKTVAADPSAPYAFSHVFIEVFHRKSGQWIPLDSTVPQSYPGWAPERVFRAKAWRTMGDTDPQAASVPGAVATSGPLPKSQVVLQIAKPLVEALSQRIAYGSNPPRPKSLNVGINTTSLTAGGVPPIALYAGGALALGTIVWLSRGRK